MREEESALSDKSVDQWLNRKSRLANAKFVIDKPRPGSENMKLDLEWLQYAESCFRPFTLIRFYQWAPPAVSLGKHQTPSDSINCNFCSEHGIPLVKRPSGGRAVFHCDELTYSVISNDERLFPTAGIDATYKRIARALQTGFSRLNIETSCAPGHRQTAHASRQLSKSPCFSSSSKYELTCRGRKVAGSAQRRLSRSFLQHGSIPLRINYKLMSEVLGCSVDLLSASMISIQEAGGRDVGFEELASALQLGFEEILIAEDEASTGGR